MHRLNRLTLKQLRALHEVTKTGSISAAANLLGLTPPAVHSQLKTLEENFECLLLERSAEGFAPTEAGKALLIATREAEAALSRAIHQIEALNKGLSGSVVLGVVSTGKYFAPRIVALLNRHLPDVEIVLRIGNRRRIIEALTTRALDLAIMGRPPRHPEVAAQSLGDHPHLLVARPDHPLAQGQMARPDDILAERFVMREEGSGTRILCSRFLDELGQGKVVDFTEMESNETIKQAVMSGLGIALLSGHTMIDEIQSGRIGVIRAAGLPIFRQWFVVHRADQELSPASATVQDWIAQNSAVYLPQPAP